MSLNFTDVLEKCHCNSQIFFIYLNFKLNFSEISLMIFNMVIYLRLNIGQWDLILWSSDHHICINCWFQSILEKKKQVVSKINGGFPPPPIIYLVTWIFIIDLLFTGNQ